uniref:Lipocalin/cytosolic fatty-acid binding domain-containing protein n=1 Tax=Alexandrium catenella TaxID=2925 RepID=A0A7S1S6I7_ALECA
MVRLLGLLSLATAGPRLLAAQESDGAAVAHLSAAFLGAPVDTAASVEECPEVTTQPNFDLDSFISKRWYAQQQMPVLYLPASQNYCVYAEYRRLERPSFFGFTIQVHNYAQDFKGGAHDSGTIICARSDDPQDPAKLLVGPWFLPAIRGITAGPYWVVAHDEAEGYALVAGGQPTIRGPGGCRTGSGLNNAGLWIFTREQRRNEALVQKVRGIARGKGFDLSVLNDVDQNLCSGGESEAIRV